MRVHALQHVPFEGVGSITAWAESRNHTLTISHIYAGEPLPAPAYDMLVIMGGPMGAYDEQDHPWLAPEKKAIEAAVAADKAVLGICLGAQLLAVVLGGTVSRNPVAEIGWFPVSLTPEGAALPVFAGFPQRFPALHWHGDMFSIPPDAVHAASSDACAQQAFVYRNRVVGLQFHLESTPATMQNLIKFCAADVCLPGPTVQHPKQLHAGREGFKEIKAHMNRLLDNLAAMAAG